jgi:aryl-alcohol dehydrogenase-like predicted oxidoreductase
MPERKTQGLARGWRGSGLSHLGSVGSLGQHVALGARTLLWLLSRPAVGSVIVSAETVDELRAHGSAADIRLEPSQLDALAALADEPARASPVEPL